MAALTAKRDTRKQVGDPIPPRVGLGMAADVGYKGGMAAVNASGYLQAAGQAVAENVIGRFVDTYDNSGGSPGDINGEVEQGVFRWANGDSIAIANIGDPCYASDDQTVAKSDAAGSRPFAGIIVDVDSQGVWVLQGLFVTEGGGAAAQGTAASGEVLFSLQDFREVDANGDVGAIAANGGVLASDTTPILRADANESEEISWATGDEDPIQRSVTLPSNFDGTADATLELYVYSGTTDAATFTVETSWDGGTKVTDTATDASPAATVHKITATIAAADIPDAAARLTLHLAPAAHATDAIQLVGARLLWG